MNSVGTPQLRDGAVTARKLGGNAVATSKLQDGAVTSRKIRAGTITAAQLKKGAISNLNIADSALTTTKLHDGAVTASKLAPGAITPANVPAGAGVNVTYRFGTVTVGPGQQLSAHVACPSGTTVVGGGMTASDPSVVLNDSAPFNSGAQQWTGGPSDSWGVFVTNSDSSQSHVVAIYATCIVASAVH